MTILYNEQTNEQHTPLAQYDSFNKNLFMQTMVLNKTCYVALGDVDLPLPLLLLYFTIENLFPRLTTGLDEKSVLHR